jgi:hypothetical protein
MRTTPVGRRFDGPSIAPIEEKMVRIEAGAIQFGIEYRLLDGQTVGDFLDGAGKAVSETVKGGWKARGKEIAEIDDQGVCIHVFNGATGEEHLRFDIFREGPHYHYFTPSGSQYVVDWDDVADPDYKGWVLNALENRVSAMLALTGAPDLANRVDPRVVSAALEKVRKAIDLATGSSSRDV